MKSTHEDMDDLAGTATGELMGRVRGAVTRNFVMQELMAGLFEKIHRLRLPVIAAVNGTAHGGGFALALACDIRIATREASFGAVFIKRGVSACDMGTSYYLPRLVGASRSAELLLTGRVFGAEEAERIGLVLEVVDAREVVDRALAKAREIAENSPLAVWMTKETMWQTVDSPSLRHALDLENRTQIMCTATGELNQAFAAFREGRKPEWDAL
jgi:enoyl-CoA hydratase/carnithine racemase